MNQTSAPNKEDLFIYLTVRAMNAERASDLKFIILNQTYQLVAYEQALYFDINSNKKGSPVLFAASGLDSIDDNSPFNNWVTQLAKGVNTDSGSVKLTVDDLDSKLSEDWDEWLPSNTLWVPLKNSQNALIGLVMYAKSDDWTELQVKQLNFLHEVYAYTLNAILNKPSNRSTKLANFFKLSNTLTMLLAMFILMFIPVRLSALAPAEVIALNAVNIAAPQNGVVKSFLVEPNEYVTKGDLLFTLDDTALSGRYKVALKALEVANADVLVAKQRAFNDEEGKAALSNAKSRVKEKQAELASIQSLLSRVEVRAQQDGVAIFSDKSDWIGRPVQTGEMIVQIADPKDAGLLVWLPAKDALSLNKGAPMKVFLHTDPLHPIEASLYQTSYQATPGPNEVSSYRLKGRFSKNLKVFPRIGLGGTARVSGEWSILGYYLFRRPISAFREWFGI